MKERFKRVIFSIVMIALICVVCFAVLEFVFARFYYSNVYTLSHMEFDPTVGWRPKPGTHWVKPPGSFRKHTVYVNRHRLRGKDISPAKPDRVERIVILGDSFTYAKGNRTENTFPVRLEGHLNEGLTHPGFEILNAGVMGYGTAQELLLMRELAKDGIIADAYVLMVFTNDILDNLRLFYHRLSVNRAQPGFALDRDGHLILKYHPERWGRKRAQGPIAAERTPRRTNIATVLRVRIGTYLQTRPDLLMLLSRLGFKVEFPCVPGVISGWYTEDFLNEGIPLMKALLKEIRQQADMYGAKLLVCCIPSELQVYPETYGPMLRKSFPESELVDGWLNDNSRPQRVLGEMCADLGVPYLDLLPVMSQHNDRALYTAAEGHFNKEGHFVVAEALAEFVRLNCGSE